MKKLISSLCLCAVSILSFAQGPVEKIGAPAGHKEVLTIKIVIAGAQTVTADSLSITMIPFSGTVDCPNFKGEVLPTGVDTQVGKPTGRTLSARYMIKGKDIKGEECTIFIENNGDMGEKYTRPFIVTDSKALSFLNNALLLGQLDFTSGGLTIRIYCPDELIR